MAKPSDEWTDVGSETPTRVVFDTIGDEFIGTYNERRTITPNESDPFDILVFTGTDGNLYSMSGFKLLQTFEDIDPGTQCRILYTKDVPIKGQVSPMKDFKVQVKS